MLDAAAGEKHDSIGAVASRRSDGLKQSFRREESRRRVAYQSFVDVPQAQNGLAFRLRMDRLRKALERLLELALARARRELGKRGLGKAQGFRSVRAALTLAG